MKNLVLACVVALAFCPMAAVADIAISTQAGWFGQAAADREMQEIADNVTAVAVEQFTADDQAALADWVVAHTGDGVSDLLILCGQFPDAIYPGGNAQPDGSLAELFLDDGNIIVNTGDYMFYVNNAGANNDVFGLHNMMDIAVDMWDDNTPANVTADGQALTPTLADFQTDRPFHLDQLEGPWYAELILAQNDAGTRADPVIVANVDTGGRLGIFYQTASQDDDPRGEVMSEWINNWYLTAGEVANPGFPALSPDPMDGAVDVTTPLFKWTAGYGATMHNVYFGTDPEALEFKMPMPSPMYFHLEPLEPGATYYWRIDEVAADGSICEGNVWSFTVMPLEAHFPSPHDGALWVKTELVASWAPGQGAVSHVLYADTDEAAVAAGDESVLLGSLPEPTFDATGLLEPLTTYYWRIDEVDADGAVHEGPVWSFSTIDPEGGCVGEYWANQYFTGAPDIVKIEPEVNVDFNADRDGSPDPCIPVDNFSCRWTAALNVPVTGTYILSEGSDDGSRMYLNGELVAEGWWDRGTTWDYTEPLELVAGERYLLVMEMYENGGGATAYLRWEGPGIPLQIIPQGALQLVDWAVHPEPANGAEGVVDMPVLSWLPGDGAVEHDVYLGTSQSAVAAGDAGVLQGRVAETVFVLAGALNWNTTYYWKVDEVAEDGTIVPGDVWSFSVADYIPVIDGTATLEYDNTVEPYVSELVTAVDPTRANWTKNGVTSLQLEIKGNAPKISIDNGTITMMGAGADIWGNADEFRYAYKELNGDASMIARVVDNGTGSNEWAKGGVMIRQSVEAGSTHAFMPITAGGGNGASFQHRLVADSGSTNNDSVEVVAPAYWVKIDRVGNDFSGSISADGVEWTQLGDPQTIEMADPVLIGLAVTSHASGELRTFEFDNVSTTGDVAGDWTLADVGVAQGGNDPAPLYIALEDSVGGVGVVPHPGSPEIVLNEDWTTWKILLSRVPGVDESAITAMIAGVGDGEPGGVGSVQIRNVKVVKPFQIDVENASFEKPGTPDPYAKLFGSVVQGFGKVPGWNTDSTPSYSGVIKGASPTSGSWSAYLWGYDPSLWQLTGHTIVEGEEFVLDADASVIMGAIRDSTKNLKISIYYDNDGARVPVASTTGKLSQYPKHFSLSFKSGDARGSVGHRIGIEVTNISDNWVSFDNVNLKLR